MTEPTKIALTLLVVLAIGLVALAFEWLREKVSGWLALLIIAAVLVMMALSIRPIAARDLDGRHAGSPLKPWFDQLKNGQGDLCCSDADGTAISDADWRSRNGGYQVFLEGAWRDVPESAVITEPNRAGRTMVWPLHGYMGLTIRCFMPGSMT